MSATAWGAAVDEWGVLAAVVASLGGVAVALWQAYNSRRAGVSGDEREARRDEQTDRRDTIADRDSLIQSLDRRLASVEERYGDALDRIADLEQRETDTRTLLMMHAAWDWQVIELAREGGITLPPPPPLMAPHVPRPREEDH